MLEDNEVYMYPLAISNEGARALFLQLAEATHQLEAEPRFYNSLTSNCTNELAKAANRARPGAIPLNRALIFPGYSAGVLYDLGFLPNDLPLEQLNQKYYVTDLVRQHNGSDDFSSRLRADLARRWAAASLPATDQAAPAD